MYIKRIFVLSAIAVFLVAINAQQKSAQFGVSCTVLAPPENWSGVVQITPATTMKASTATPRMRFINVGGVSFNAGRFVVVNKEGQATEAFNATLPTSVKLEAKSSPQPSYIRVTFQTDASPGTEPTIEEIE